jgi:hypothetical protein
VMAGLIRPKHYPIRDVKDDKQDAGMIYNSHRMAHHGGLDSTSKWPKGNEGSAFSVEPPTKVRSAEASKRSSDG